MIIRSLDPQGNILRVVTMATWCTRGLIPGLSGCSKSTHYTPLSIVACMVKSQLVYFVHVGPGRIRKEPKFCRYEQYPCSKLVPAAHMLYSSGMEYGLHHKSEAPNRNPIYRRFALYQKPRGKPVNPTMIIIIMKPQTPQTQVAI